MCQIDLMHTVLLAINILKSQVATPWDWDPYQTIGQPTWIQASFLSLLFLVFPFTSIKLPISTQSATRHILLRFGEFNTQLTVAFIGSILFPQALFWYFYPIIISVFIWYPWLFNFLMWSHGVLTTIPVCNIIIRATVTSLQNLVPPQPEVEAQPTTEKV
ncbi:hypothetical protein ACB092_10G042500 [Castanea dentata]